MLIARRYITRITVLLLILYVSVPYISVSLYAYYVASSIRLRARKSSVIT